MDTEDWMVDVRVALRTHDFEQIESLRGELAKECLNELVAEYQRRTDWSEKSALVFLLQDHRDARLEPVMRDALAVPDSGDDVAWEVRAIALCHLDRVPFRRYFEDRELTTRRVKELIGQ